MELFQAEVALKITSHLDVDVASSSLQTYELERELKRVNQELERYTSYADKSDYAISIASGILAGIIDSVYVGETTISGDSIKISHKQVNQFIQKYAEKRGIQHEKLKDAIPGLEEKFKLLQDNIWKGEGIGISAKEHHLADLAHHPTPIGLLAAIITQFLRVGIFLNKDGEWHIIPVKTDKGDITEIIIPAIITGLMNWLVSISFQKKESEGHKTPDAITKLSKTVATIPVMVEIAKCADNWFGHLVSDMGGSKQRPGAGMGIPGIFLSMLYEISGLPILKDSGLPAFLNDLYVKGKLDLRHEIPLYKTLGKQAIPVMLNELFVRTMYFMSRLASEMKECDNIKDIDWNRVIPIKNRTVDRMMTVASMTFTMADTADAAVHAAVESGGNWVLFSGKFVTRFNYVGAGRAMVAVVKEVSNDKKEAQLLHEKRLLTEAKTEIVLKDLQKYKDMVEEKLATYMAEDISAFLEGFDYIQQGINDSDSNLVIRGNVTIQKVMGRQPQFQNQKEFDELMESEAPLQL